MMKGKSLKATAMLLTTATIFSLSACSGSPSTSSPTLASSGTTSTAVSQPIEKGPPTQISIFTEFHTAEAPSTDNPVLKVIEEKTNTKLDIWWTSPANYEEKINTILASGNLPDLMKVKEFKNAQMQMMAQQGALWDLAPYLSEYSELMLYPQEVYNAVKIDGKQYLLPSVRPQLGASDLYSIRRDWLDNLKLEYPKTMDELYDVFYAFTYNDPDGNGKNDTWGYSGRKWKETFRNSFNNANGFFKMVDGKIVDTITTAETRQGLEWMKKLYDNKLMPEDFAVLNDVQTEDLAKGGRAGASSDTVEGIFRSTDAARKLDPKADFEPMAYLEGPAGKYNEKGPGFTGLYMIPKKTVDETKLKAVLNLMNYGASEEGFTLSCYGIKDVHYTIDADGFKVTTPQAEKDSVSQSSFGKIFERYDKYLWAYRTGMDKETFERNKKIIDEREPYAVADPTVGLISTTAQKKLADITKKVDDLQAKVIMGKASLEEWDSFSNGLKTDETFQKILQEFNEEYQKKYAK